jgi:hypothetical protein
MCEAGVAHWCLLAGLASVIDWTVLSSGESRATRDRVCARTAR